MTLDADKNNLDKEKPIKIRENQSGVPGEVRFEPHILRFIVFVAEFISLDFLCDRNIKLVFDMKFNRSSQMIVRGWDVIFCIST